TLAWTAAVVVLASLIAAALSGLGYQAEFWTYRTGFAMFRWSVYVCAGAALVAIACAAIAVARRESRTAIVGAAATVLALVLVIPAWRLQNTAEHVPRIHDITTDTENPPQFVALMAVRKTTPNGPEYGGKKIADQQHKGYPDIRPLVLPDPPGRAFERALAVAHAMGWEIIEAVAADGRIEATDTSRWFRFKDDIVIRMSGSSTGSRVDIRSTSRLGRSDLGANARRVRHYLEKLAQG